MDCLPVIVCGELVQHSNLEAGRRLSFEQEEAAFNVFALLCVHVFARVCA